VTVWSLGRGSWEKRKKENRAANGSSPTRLLPYVRRLVSSPHYFFALLFFSIWCESIIDCVLLRLLITVLLTRPMAKKKSSNSQGLVWVNLISKNSKVKIVERDESWPTLSVERMARALDINGSCVHTRNFAIDSWSLSADDLWVWIIRRWS
jgi:hypothetical protein